ncbi:hypothetical protein POM88_023407 [Heracleum sosnowskyi]|uniref:PRONE domain-containing protein n=1 Tax=Heracleum sosnowskyi TaxID=360622 RepID=A0AAD8IGY5_9APIA|nr:hypothetical protein POM88_023407 [Heracleum sosnowskyi]
MSSEYTTLEIANRIEASVHIWRHKYFRRHLSRAKSGRSWSGKFPGLPHTALDIQKIQYNKDVGQSILESYSRVIESLDFNLMTRIDDLQYVDDATRQRAAAEFSPMLGETIRWLLSVDRKLLASNNAWVTPNAVVAQDGSG